MRQKIHDLDNDGHGCCGQLPLKYLRQEKVFCEYQSNDLFTLTSSSCFMENIKLATIVYVDTEHFISYDYLKKLKFVYIYSFLFYIFRRKRSYKYINLMKYFSKVLRNSRFDVLIITYYRTNISINRFLYAPYA